MKKIENKTKNFIIKFEGKQNRLDSLTLVYSILGFSTILQELNNSLYPEQKIDIKVKATQPGSFEIVCQLIEYAKDKLPLLPLVIADNKEYLKGLLFLFKEFIEVKKLLGKEKPSKVKEHGEKVIIESNKGNIEVHQHTYNFYSQNINSQNALSKAFRSLEQDDEVESLKVLEDKSKELIEINEEEFPILAEPIEEVEEENIQEVIRVALLRVLKIVFDKHRMWEFIYNEVKISARLEDELFIQKIAKREIKFAQGDVLKVRLKIRQVYNEVAKTYINDSYSIVEVLETIATPPDGQQPLTS